MSWPAQWRANGSATLYSTRDHRIGKKQKTHSPAWRFDVSSRWRLRSRLSIGGTKFTLGLFDGDELVRRRVSSHWFRWAAGTGCSRGSKRSLRAGSSTAAVLASVARLSSTISASHFQRMSEGGRISISRSISPSASVSQLWWITMPMSALWARVFTVRDAGTRPCSTWRFRRASAAASWSTARFCADPGPKRTGEIGHINIVPDGPDCLCRPSRLLRTDVLRPLDAARLRPPCPGPTARSRVREALRRSARAGTQGGYHDIESFANRDWHAHYLFHSQSYQSGAESTYNEPVSKTPVYQAQDNAAVAAASSSPPSSSSSPSSSRPRQNPNHRNSRDTSTNTSGRQSNPPPRDSARSSDPNITSLVNIVQSQLNISPNCLGISENIPYPASSITAFTSILLHHDNNTRVGVHMFSSLFCNNYTFLFSMDRKAAVYLRHFSLPTMSYSIDYLVIYWPSNFSTHAYICLLFMLMKAQQLITLVQIFDGWIYWNLTFLYISLLAALYYLWFKNMDIFYGATFFALLLPSSQSNPNECSQVLLSRLIPYDSNNYY